MPGLVALKKEFGAFLMVDEAHALGVLGKTGKGTAEHFGLQPGDIDITMGTLSKTCCTCGGYIAGSAELIELLKFTSPGFVYSVGMSPVLAAASAKAIEIMLREPERVQKLQHISHFFVQEAKRLGLDTGHAEAVLVRFFLSAAHTEETVRQALSIVAREVQAARQDIDAQVG